MNIEEIVQVAVLNKYYGKLLTDRQQDILKMYVDNNLSLQEVSEELSISRQAVKDAVDTAIVTLKSTEEKLGFVARDEKIKHILEDKSEKDISMMTRLEIIALLEDI
ncbi:MAG: hypothetical protein IKM43_03520 [Clostridia bacterium]|nr:hypothetical protein [Clostridia bacterium]